MKKLFFLTLACVLTMQTPVFADYGDPNYTMMFQQAQKDGFMDFQIRPLTLLLGEQSRAVESFTAAKTLFVPLREAAAFLGKTVHYDKTTHTITLLDEPPAALPPAKPEAGTKRFYLRSVLILHENHVFHFKDGHPLLADAYSLDGRLYVPLKLLTETSACWFSKEEDIITFHSASGMVTPVRTISCDTSEGWEESKQLFDLPPLSVNSRENLKPYVDEIRLRERYAFGDFLQIKSMEHALVLYEDAPHILTCSHLLPLEDCVAFQHYTLYRLDIPETYSISETSS